MNSRGPIRVVIDPDLKAIVPGFLENMRRDCARLLVVLTAGDMEQLAMMGHNLKGVGGGYGFDAISEIGRAIEAAAKSGDKTVIASKAAELEDYLARVEPVIGPLS